MLKSLRERAAAASSGKTQLLAFFPHIFSSYLTVWISLYPQVTRSNPHFSLSLFPSQFNRHNTSPTPGHSQHAGFSSDISPTLKSIWNMWANHDGTVSSRKVDDKNSREAEKLNSNSPRLLLLMLLCLSCHADSQRVTLRRTQMAEHALSVCYPFCWWETSRQSCGDSSSNKFSWIEQKNRSQSICLRKAGSGKIADADTALPPFSYTLCVLSIKHTSKNDDDVSHPYIDTQLSAPIRMSHQTPFSFVCLWLCWLSWW